MSKQEEEKEVNEKFDAVIEAKDLFEPIRLGRTQKEGDCHDANNGNLPILPPKQNKARNDSPHNLISESGQMRSAGSILGLDMPENIEHDPQQDKEIRIHDLIGKPEAQCQEVAFSESVKAFFGKSTGKDCVDAGSESSPSYEYNMRHKFRGCLIIFNHMHFLPKLGVNSRKGTDEDGKNLTKTARKLGFEYIRTFNDLDEDDIMKWVTRVADADHSDYDCFALAVLTHGDEGDILYAHDKKYHLDNLTEPFMAKNCPTLAGKPKLFFIQACRGQTLDEGAPVVGGDTVDALVQPVANKSEKEVMIIPNAADFLLAFSTVPGYYAWRNQACGSWFIQALCKCLREYGDKLELMQIMTRVNRMVAYDFTSYSTQNRHFHGKKQIPSIVTRLTHEVFFRKKKSSRTSSPLRPKHKLPVLEQKKCTHDGQAEPNGDSSIKNENGNNKNRVKGLRETSL